MNFKKRVNGSWTDTPHYIHNTSTDAITTLPADVYADGNNATVGLKGNMSQTGVPTPQNPIQPSECGERTGNLFDYTVYFDSTFIPYNEFFNYAELQLQPNTTYTLSTSYEEYAFNTTRITAFIVATSSGIPTTSNGGISNVSPITITTESDGVLKLYKRISGSNEDMLPTEEQFEGGDWIMLNLGSTALPYEPYGIKIPISMGGTTNTVYLGEVQTERQIQKLVLTGNETFSKNTNDITDYNYWLLIPDIGKTQRVICTHIGYIAGIPSGGTIGVTTRINTHIMYINFGADIMNAQTSGNTKNGLKEYLTAQYANGTPVTIWYVLATEETGIVNEPLMKIGDYADTVSGITIPTITGKDTVDVETTLKPSEVELTYTGWHDATVKEWDGSQWD